MEKAAGSVTKRTIRGKVKWLARVWWRDSTGRRRESARRCDSRARAIAERDAMLLKVESGRAPQPCNTTFAQFVAFYNERYACPAEYAGDPPRKIAGCRDWRDRRRRVAVLTKSFGPRLMRTITYPDLQQFRAELLHRPKVRGGGQRSIADANRALALLRRILNIAVQQRVIDRNPFHDGDSLISTADEKARDRVLSFHEEKALMAAIDAAPHPTLRAVVICAICTGMRLGEIRRLQWRDVDLATGRIRVVAMNTKTMRERTVPIPPRLALELQRLRQRPGAPRPAEDELVFQGRPVDHPFRACRDAASLADLRFHDLRATAGTRLAEGGIAPELVGKILGHTVPATTYRYLRPTTDTLDRAAEILNRSTA